MADIKSASATSALNEDQYINKLYDNVIDKQKSLLNENQNAAATELDALNKSVQQQANTNLGRVNVEAQKLQQAYKAPNVSSSAQQQIALAMDNQKKKNVATTQTVQNEAEAEIDRQRKLLGEQYAAQIKKAQADNDMARAQQLYNAAKQEDEQLLALKKQAGQQLAAVGDNSVLTALMEANPVARDTAGQTWDGVLQNEAQLNKIYDSAIESDRQAAQMALNEAKSKIAATQAAETASTDKNLTQTYVNALKRNKNYNEVQNAYGLGSGNLAQARLAQALGLTEDLTNQRGILMDNTAARGQQQFAAGQNYRDALAASLAGNEQDRANALYKAAENEEQNLIENQQAVGKTLAEQGDYSVLGKLYGLTQDQIDRLQGTGAYAPQQVTGGTPGAGGGRTTLNDALEQYYGKEYDATGNDTVMSEAEVDALYDRLNEAAEVDALYDRLNEAAKLDAQMEEQNAWKTAILQANKAAAAQRQEEEENRSASKDSKTQKATKAAGTKVTKKK